MLPGLSCIAIQKRTAVTSGISRAQHARTALVSSDLDRPQKLAQAPGEEDEREGDHERDR
jgi:hypothetical protein